MKTEISFQQDISVEFHDEEKALEYFIAGDWKDTFFEFNDLDDFAEFLANIAKYKMIGEVVSGDQFRTLTIEGVPFFTFQGGELVADCPETGKITISGDRDSQSI